MPEVRGRTREKFLVSRWILYAPNQLGLQVVYQYKLFPPPSQMSAPTTPVTRAS